METHICPHCSKECAYKNGIMCTIQGCIKESSKNDDFLKALFGQKNGTNDATIDGLRSIFGMK